MSRMLRLSLVLLLTAGGLAACGKRGPLEPPGGREAAKQQQQAEAKAADSKAADRKAGDGKAGDGKTGDQATPKTGGRKRIPITAPKRDLPIDFILE